MTSPLDSGPELPAWPLDAEPGPAPPLADDESRRMVEIALQALSAPMPAASELSVLRAGTGASRPPRVRMILLVAAVATLFATAAGASFYLARRARQVGASPSTSVPVSVPVPSASSSPSKGAQTASRPAASVDGATSATAAMAASPSAVRKPESPVETEDLLRAANDLRAHSRWADAERMYQRVITGAPGSVAAYTATVAAASLRLEHLGDAVTALRLFQAAVRARPQGLLAEEARYGVAESQRRLGNSTGEAEALRGFVAAHPSSFRRKQAEARLRELQATSP